MQGTLCILGKGLMAAPPESLLRGEHLAVPPDVTPLTAENEPNVFLPQLDYDLVQQLFDHGLALGHANDESDEYQLDRWLAPRIHAAIRVPRRIASQRRFWAWVAMKFAPPYVYQRFAEDGVVTGWRYTGDLLRNAVSRLWWAAELLRDGPDYSSVDVGLRRVRGAQFALELKYSWFRPAAVGFVKVAENPTDRLNDREMKALSVRANAYFPLAPLEAIGFSDRADSSDTAWWASGITKKDLLAAKSPSGPNDGLVDAVALAEVVKWYREVLVEERAAVKAGSGIQE